MLVALPDGYNAEQVRPALAAAVARLPEQLAAGQQRAPSGLLCQYLAKGTDLRQFDQAALDAIAAELNGRPRQTLGFTTPSQALAEALPSPSQTTILSEYGDIPAYHNHLISHRLREKGRMDRVRVRVLPGAPSRRSASGSAVPRTTIGERWSFLRWCTGQ